MQCRVGFATALLALCTAAVPQVAGGGRIELVQCLYSIPTIVGTHGDDVLLGTPRDDVIVGLAGDDVIYGDGGNDLICGGDGDDVIFSGLWLFESDAVSGDGGNDVMIAGATMTTAVYEFSPGPVSVDLDAGTAAGWGDDKLAGVFNVVGSRYADRLRGSGQINCLYGLEGNDRLEGLAGDDCLSGDPGDDSLDGGAGNDLISFAQVRSRMTVNLFEGSSRGEGHDRLTSIERVIGSSLRDVLTGDAGPNELSGGGGADRMAGGPGMDRLDGGDGRDRVDGGVGRDRCLNAELRSRCP
jgi:Ca2+-binding RTX toxin-like protein